MLMTPNVSCTIQANHKHAVDMFVPRAAATAAAELTYHASLYASMLIVCVCVCVCAVMRWLS